MVGMVKRLLGFSQMQGMMQQGGLKVTTANGYGARPSGTEDVYKIYAESFISKEHLKLYPKRGERDSFAEYKLRVKRKKYL